MTKYSSGYDRERRLFKAECAATNAPCWLCNNSRGPIDYTSKYVRGTKQPLLFNLDHAEPTSLGGDAVRRTNFRPSHYPHLQRKPREHHTRAVSDVQNMVKTGLTGWGMALKRQASGPPGRALFSPHQTSDPWN